MRLQTCAAAFVALVCSSCALNGGNADNAGALDAIAQNRDGVEVTVEGPVIHVLAESNGESGTHDRFVIEVRSGSKEQDILIADNVSIGRTAPIQEGDDVTVKGVLAIDPSGPVIHWTHHDPSGRHESGFIRDRGVLYN